MIIMNKLFFSLTILPILLFSCSSEDTSSQGSQLQVVTNSEKVFSIDDFYNLDTNNNYIREEFFKYFNLNKNVFLHSNFGIGGVCFRYFKTKNN